MLTANSEIETPKKVVLRGDSDYDRMEEGMQFRLTYAGELLAASRDNTRAKHKHEIRRKFHPQLRKLWEVTHLRDMVEFTAPFPYGMIAPSSAHPLGNRLKRLQEQFRRNGYSFVPLVTKDLAVACGIEILFLRPGVPGTAMESGDIDNRLKTLFDALRMPDNADEIKAYPTPSADETPFYCLLADDKLISKVSVETDILLEPSTEEAGENDA